GFVSKDEILVSAYLHNKAYFWLASVAAIMTAFYMFRLLMLTFHGSFRGTEEQKHHLHESPIAITIPLIVLALFSLLGGFIQLSHLFGGHPYLNEYLANAGVPSAVHEGVELTSLEYGLFGGTVVLLLVVFLTTKKYFAVDKFSGEYTGFGKIL